MGIEILYGIGTLILLGGMIYAVVQWSRRDKRNAPITEAATREEYKNPERYAANTQEAFEDLTKR